MDPLNGAIREYCRTVRHRTGPVVANNTSNNASYQSRDDSGLDQDLRTYEFEFHKKRSFLSEVIQNTDISRPDDEENWFIPKSMVHNWSDWILDIPDWSGWGDLHDQSEHVVDPTGFNRADWSQSNVRRDKLFSPNRWELMEKVHYFTQRLFFNWKWNVRCATFRGEQEVIMGSIPLYQERIIPILFGCMPDGRQIFHRFGLESVFLRVLRTLRREQFGLTLRAGQHEMVISYHDIRIREERGMSWDGLIVEFLSALQGEYGRRWIPDMRNEWKRMGSVHNPIDKMPGLTLEWWVTWGEYWNEVVYTPVNTPTNPPPFQGESDWDGEIGGEDEQEDTEN